MNEDDDIIQIIPAAGWWVEYQVEGDPLFYPLVAWGLRRDGEVIPLDADPQGVVSELGGNVLRVFYDPFRGAQ